MPLHLVPNLGRPISTAFGRPFSFLFSAERQTEPGGETSVGLTQVMAARTAAVLDAQVQRPNPIEMSPLQKGALRGMTCGLASGRCGAAFIIRYYTVRFGRSSPARLPAAIGLVLIGAPPNASASTPSHTPARLANGASGHADTTNSCPAHSASVGDFRGQAVRLMKRHGRHRLRRRCGG
jgi:hypothetical protein